jgi:hypothetical protein
MYIFISYLAGILIALIWFLPRSVWCYELFMFTSVISHLIGLQVGCSRSVVQTMLLYAVLSCRWAFGLCRGCCVDGCKNTQCMWQDVQFCLSSFSLHITSAQLSPLHSTYPHFKQRDRRSDLRSTERQMTLLQILLPTTHKQLRWSYP